MIRKTVLCYDEGAWCLSNVYGLNIRGCLYYEKRIGIKQKEKYYEYSSEQAIEAINRCSEFLRI